METPSAPVSAFSMYSDTKRRSQDNSKVTPKRKKRAHSTSSESELKISNVTSKKNSSNGLKSSPELKNDDFNDVNDESKITSPDKSILNQSNPSSSKKVTTNGTNNNSPIKPTPQKKKTYKKSKLSENVLNKSVEEDLSQVNELSMKSRKSTPKKSTPKKSTSLETEKLEIKSEKKSKKLGKNNPIFMSTPIQSNGKVEEKEEEEQQFTNNINPKEEASTLFAWLIYPMSVEDFFKKNWEKAPLYIERKKADYYKSLMSTPMIDSILRKYNILFSKNLDITSYSNGQRETHNPPGRALPSVVWDYYSNGCSIRMLNPQTFIPNLHALNSTLQEYFGCFIGSNFYLTPPDSQGFAPHYDDIEAFILQIEGKKRWRLYAPRKDEEFLPRYSSKNFDQSEIGKPVLDIVVEAGDILYFPRGTIHQGETVDGSHSLHVTLSCYQKNSWSDYLEKLVPEALKKSSQCIPDFRRGLPFNYLNEIGYVHSEKNSEFREKFVDHTKQLLHRMIDMIDIDKAVDEMAKSHIHDYLPPVLTPVELECSVLQDGEKMIKQGVVINRVEIEPDTRIRLSRAHCVRLVEEEDNTWRIYYSPENSKEYHEYEQQFLELDTSIVPAVKKIITSYPDFVKVDDLPIDGEDNRVQVARDLWEKCIVLTDVPLPIIE